jgi:pimeloyl-ACP methyl ester carboxylesterase
MDGPKRATPDGSLFSLSGESDCPDSRRVSERQTTDYNEIKPQPRIVISLHGIRTRGEWQKELNETFGPSFKHIPLDYGHFSALSLLLKKQRRAKVKWFRDQYTRICDDYKIERPCLIAHSMGTYLFAHALKLFPELEFDRVILCGSIVPCDFPWSFFSDRFHRLLNDSGRADFWVRQVRKVVIDGGPSGVEGFSDLAGGRVIQRENQGFRHSDYFYKLHYTKVWIPFLEGFDPPTVPELPIPKFNWAFARTIGYVAIMLVLLSFGSWFGWRQIVKTWKANFSESAFGFVRGNEAPDPVTQKTSKPIVNDAKLPPKRLPFPDDQFPIKLHQAEDTGGAEWTAFAKDYIGCEIHGLECDCQNELIVDEMDREEGLSGIKVIFGTGDFAVVATAYLAPGKLSSHYHGSNGRPLALVKGTLAQVKPDGSIRLDNCVFDP